MCFVTVGYFYPSLIFVGKSESFSDTVYNKIVSKFQILNSWPEVTNHDEHASLLIPLVSHSPSIIFAGKAWSLAILL